MAKQCEWKPIQTDKGQVYLTGCGKEWHGDLTKNCPICGKRVSTKTEKQRDTITEKQGELF